MIDMGGASLIATVYPIGILIVAVEARALPGVPLPPKGSSRLKVKNNSDYWRTILSWQNFYSSMLSLGVAMPLFATAFCVIAVGNSGPVGDGFSTYVWISGGFLFVAVLLVIGRLSTRTSG